MTPRGHCPVCHRRLGTSLTSCVCGWKMLDPMPRQDLELPPPVGFVLRAEHDRLIAEKDAEIERLREAIDGAAFQITVLANRLETHEDDMASPSREFSSRLRDTAIRAMKGGGQ